MRRSRILAIAAVGVLGVVPGAVAVMADPFGPVEVADPTFRPGPLFTDGTPFFGADGAGNVVLGTIHRDSSNDEQMAVYERCGAGPVTWQRTVLSDVDGGVMPSGLRVAQNGTAMAIWSVSGGGTVTHYSSVRPPGGQWEPPQVVVSDLQVTFGRFAMSDAGDAIATWTDSSPVGTWASVRPSGGTWGAPEPVVATTRAHGVAMGAAGEAVVLYQGPTPGYLFSKFRPAAGGWGAEQKVLENNFQNTLQELMVEFDGAGRAVALARFRELNDAIRRNARSAGVAGTWGSTDQVLDDDGANPPNPSFDLRKLRALVRHPAGAVAVWTRRQTSSNFNDDIVVSRETGGAWEAPIAFDLGNSFNNATAATNAAGEILLAGPVNHGAGSGVDDIWATIAPSISAPWPVMSLVSPPANATTLYRDAFAAGGGTAFSVGWGVHGASNERTEVISTKPAGATCGSAPTPTPTATATASPNPLPAPSATPTPDPSVQNAPVGPSAIADFTTLPAASKCVRNRKLTLRMKKPPKGYVVKTVTVKVNAKKVATLKGKQLQRPLYLRRLPAGKFTVTVSIKLTKGKGLTERRTYTACK